MISSYRFFLLSILLLIFVSKLSSQQFNGEWSCEYSTIDDQPNGTGYNTIAVAVVGEDNFVALVRRESNRTNYLVGYNGADSINGRLGNYAYGTSGVGGDQQTWISGFDQVFMREAKSIAAVNNLILVPNNDENYNILVFELTADSVISHPKRMSTLINPFDVDSLWAITTDAAGRVYVTTHGSADKPSKVLIYESFEKESKWGDGFDAQPLQIITLPDNGSARGIAVNPLGTALYVSNYEQRKVYCYIGDADNGYTIYNGFDASYNDDYITATETIEVGPFGLEFMPTRNILFMASDADFLLGTAYEYAKIFALNPNTGEFLDTIDVAQWNYVTLDSSYTNRAGGTTPGNASGYASTYHVDTDGNDNLYSQSYFGWTVEKWNFSGTLPDIQLTITSIEKEDNIVPTGFMLDQNYPNPFNPSTTIRFTVNDRTRISLDIFSITGELVASVINSREFDVGAYKVTFDASGLASGTYIYTISNGFNKISKKMTLIK
ncbi:MAG: T9SS type A sorting domain-containing protein [Bacteroidetes bacterium]|nr:T9SS type A sorting domain-containing protein [Bacteroidota bacterium]